MKHSQSEALRRSYQAWTSPQAFGQRMKTGKFSSADLEKIASALGAELVCVFKFPDGTEI